ncbi:MAG: low temperature requirement protein A [Cyanobacteria bacterium P01_C01_bin.121]
MSAPRKNVFSAAQSRARFLRLNAVEQSGGERHATWLELFFDLVFVLTMAELANLLHGNPDWTGLVSFAALFVPVWWLWIDFSYYADQFDVNEGLYRLIFFGIMFGIVVLALTVPAALGEGSVNFAAVYAALRLVIIGLYMQAWRLVPRSRELTARYATSFSVAFVLWVISMGVPMPLRFWLWAIALFIEISNGPITYLTIKNVPQQQSHMDERFGLFVIIVLGEAIIAVASGVADTAWQWRNVLTALGGFMTAVSLWWMYFERSEESMINQALRGGKMALLRSYVYGYSHLFTFMGIVATGVGIQFAIEAASGDVFSWPMRTALCGGVAVFLSGTTILQWASPSCLPRRAIMMRIIVVAISLSLLPLGELLPPFAIVCLLACLLVGVNKYDGVPIAKT